MKPHCTIFSSYREFFSEYELLKDDIHHRKKGIIVESTFYLSFLYYEKSYDRTYFAKKLRDYKDINRSLPRRMFSKNFLCWKFCVIVIVTILLINFISLILLKHYIKNLHKNLDRTVPLKTFAKQQKENAICKKSKDTYCCKA